MWRHDFHTIGDCGHKRNFTWYSGKKRDLKTVTDYCHICERKMVFKVLFYLETVSELDNGIK